MNALTSSFRVSDILTKLELFSLYCILLKATGIKCHESASRGSQVPREQADIYRRSEGALSTTLRTHPINLSKRRGH